MHIQVNGFSGFDTLNRVAFK